MPPKHPGAELRVQAEAAERGAARVGAVGGRERGRLALGAGGNARER